jgi:hypothetical protein
VPPAERYLGAMTLATDAAEVRAAGDWVIRGLHDGERVSGSVPEVFESYARIFHPAMREVTERDLPLRAPG